MFVTVVAVMCLSSAPGPVKADRECAPDERRIEEIVTDSSLDDSITFQSCTVSGQVGIAKWKSEHPVYRSEKWRIARYLCVPGHYEVGGRA